MIFNGIGNLRPEGYQPLPGPARVKPPPKDPSGIRGHKITGLIIDELECRGCGATLLHADPDCTYCKRPNPFARARQAAKAIEVTQLDDYAPRFVFDGTLTTEEAREFASMWAMKQSRPRAWIPAPADLARDGAYALRPVVPQQPEPYRPKQPTGLRGASPGSPSLLSRIITRLFR